MNRTNIDKFFDVISCIPDTHLAPSVIFDVGSRDCKEAMRFSEKFPSASVFAFECNPPSVLICQKAIKDKYPQIRIIDKAVTNFDGRTKFYPIDPSKTLTSWADGNPGASSLLLASGKYPIEKYVQSEIEVNAVKLETFLNAHTIKQIDLMWMDLQGAELNALLGLGKRIKDVKLFHIEIEFFEIYKNQPLFWDVKSYLTKSGHTFIGFSYYDRYSGDAIFVRNDIYKLFRINFEKLRKQNVLGVPFWFRCKFLFQIGKSIKIIK